MRLRYHDDVLGAHMYDPSPTRPAEVDHDRQVARCSADTPARQIRLSGGTDAVGLGSGLQGTRLVTRVLIIVQNLPVPFDRRVWLERQALIADQLMKGEWKILGVVRTDLVAPDWFCDPVTGRRSSPDRYAFQINHRSEEQAANVKQVWEISRLQYLAAFRSRGSSATTTSSPRPPGSSWPVAPSRGSRKANAGGGIRRVSSGVNCSGTPVRRMRETARTN